MMIGIPAVIVLALLGVVFAWVWHHYRKRTIDTHTVLFSRKNNNTVETTESILSI